MDSLTSYLPLVPILPLIGFLIIGIFGHRIGKGAVGLIACGTIAGSFVISLATAIALASSDTAAFSVLYQWFSVGAAGSTLDVNFGFYVDNLAAVMMLVVTGVGLLIHIYSVGYMADEKGFARYFAYLNLFCSAMLILVMADNLVLLFIGWEGVGLCSYLLIGYGYTDSDKAKAGQKAFVANRIGDLAVILAMFLLWGALGTLSIPAINAAATETIAAANAGALFGTTEALLGIATLVCILLFIGATGKSAQIPLYVWLPDAMAGPTPVSALIHAATMVTAGVYIIARLGPLFALTPEAGIVIALVGGLTAVWAGLIALTQTDIKKVLAYSTISQLGFMFMAAGAGAIYPPAFAFAIFHVVTHAFFKALLFMGSGSVIHAMQHAHPDKDEAFVQDMRNMGGLRKVMPVTFITFLVGSLALAGVVPFAGFWSKDEILHSVYEGASLAPGLVGTLFWVVLALGLLGAMLTAFYVFRAVAMTFFGKFRGTPAASGKLHESPRIMTIPLVILAVLSAIGGAINLPQAGGFGDGLKYYLMGEGQKGSSGLAASFHHYVSSYPTDEATHVATTPDSLAVSVAVQPDAEAWVHHEPAVYPALFGGLGASSLTLMAVSTINAILFALFGMWAYTVGRRRHMAVFERGVPRKLARASYAKFWIDELYEKAILKPVYLLAFYLYALIDRIVIELVTVNLLFGKGVSALSSLGRRLQTGLLSFYAASFVVGVIVVLAILLVQLSRLPLGG